MVRWLVVLFVMPLWHGMAHAALYKCISPTGKVAYQEVPCSNDASETTIQLKQGPSQEKVDEAKRINQSIRAAGSQYNATPDIRSETPTTTKPQENCVELAAMYEAEKTSIIESCKRRRATYCDEPAETILQIQDSIWLAGASDRQAHNYYRNRVDPPLKKLEKRLVAAHCQYKK